MTDSHRPGTTVDRTARLAGPGAAEPCPHCRHPIRHRYCEQCGELRQSARAYTMQEFGAEAAETVTNADGRLWRTIRDLFARPGELTAAYMRGDRLRYARPLQLFFFANIFYFVLASGLGMQLFHTPLRTHVSQTHHRAIAVQLVRERISEGTLSQREYIQAFDQLTTVHAKTLIIAMVPIWALFVAATQAGRGRYAAEHLVFSLHFFAAMLVIAVVQHVAFNQPLSAVMQSRGGVIAWSDWDDIVTTVASLVLGVYVYFALRRAYGEPRGWAALKALVLILGYFLTLFVYRAILFFTVHSSI